MPQYVIDPKFSFDTEVRAIVNSRKGNEIPADEPRILFVARDQATITMLEAYRDECKRLGSPAEHLQSIDERIQEFQMWQRANLHIVDRPD